MYYFMSGFFHLTLFVNSLLLHVVDYSYYYLAFHWMNIQIIQLLRNIWLVSGFVLYSWYEQYYACPLAHTFVCIYCQTVFRVVVQINTSMWAFQCSMFLLTLGTTIFFFHLSHSYRLCRSISLWFYFAFFQRQMKLNMF